MKRRLIFSSNAKRQIAEAVLHYEAKEPGLGRRFWNELKDRLGLAREHPELYRKVKGRYRRVFMHKYQHAAYFEASDKEIVILLVLHASQHPARWQKKLRED